MWWGSGLDTARLAEGSVRPWAEPVRCRPRLSATPDTPGRVRTEGAGAETQRRNSRRLSDGPQAQRRAQKAIVAMAEAMLETLYCDIR